MKSPLLNQHGLISGVSYRDALDISNEDRLTRLTEQMGLSKYPLVSMNQVHSATIARVESQPLVPYRVIDAVDGIWTTDKAICLATKTADCLPILVYHPYPLVGVIHAGRVGTQLKIVEVFLEQIYFTLGLNSGFRFWFGPAICKQCYQIDREKDLYYDLIAENKSQIASKISLDHVEICQSNLCTSCQNDLFFSYRKEGAKAGRLWTLGMLV